MGPPPWLDIEGAILSGILILMIIREITGRTDGAQRKKKLWREAGWVKVFLRGKGGGGCMVILSLGGQGGKEYLQGFSIKKRKESLPSCGINTGEKLGKHVFEPPFSPCLSRCTNEELSF